MLELGPTCNVFAGDAPTIFKISSDVTGRKSDGWKLFELDDHWWVGTRRGQTTLLTLFWKKSANSSGENLQSGVALGCLISTPIFDQSAAGSFMFEDNVLDQYSVYCCRSTNRRYSTEIVSARL